MCISKQVPFDIPDSWEWIRLGELTYNHGQKKPDTVFSYIDIGSIDNLNQKLNSVENHLELDNAPSRARKIVEKWDIIYSTVRPYLHNMCIIDKDFMHPPIASTGFAVMACLADYCRFFLFYYLLSPCFDNYANNRENSKGVAYPAINDERLYRALIPVPPMEEQQRIVAKIEQILPYIKEYELSESRIGQLNAAFPEQLKKSILQEAVQGKLVPQDPSDESASALLERIREEKWRLVKEGKIKKDKNESVIFRRDNSYYEKLNGIERCIDKEIPPFEIPDSWEWVRAGTLFQHNTGKALNASNRTGKLLDYITTSNLYWGRFELNSLKQMFFTESEIEKCTATTGDLLVCEGGDVGRAAIWNYDYDICIQNHVHKLRAYVPMSTKFFFYLFYFYKKAGLIGGRGIGIQGLSSNALHALLFPLPPVTEQNRIVKEIEALFPLCSKLK